MKVEREAKRGREESHGLQNKRETKIDFYSPRTLFQSESLSPFLSVILNLHRLIMAPLYRFAGARAAATTFSSSMFCRYALLKAFSSSSSSSSLKSEVDLKSSMLSGNSAPSRGDRPTDRNVKWVFLGCPGVGKGTYASRLSSLLGVPHIATGDLVREELSSSGPLASQVFFFFFLVSFGFVLLRIENCSVQFDLVFGEGMHV